MTCGIILCFERRKVREGCQDVRMFSQGKTRELDCEDETPKR